MTMPGNYFTSPPRADSNASLPVLAACRGAKLLTPKEQPKASLNPDAIKSILDSNDVDVCARHNHSLQGEQTTFPVTWTIVIQSQGAIEVAKGEEDTGLESKIVDLRPPFEFVKAEDVVPNTRMRPADREMQERAKNGSLDAELLTWARALFPLLGRDICPNRSIEPRPRSVMQNAEQATANSQLRNCKDFLAANCEHVAQSREASPFLHIKKAMKAAVGDNINESIFTALGLGEKSKYLCRQGAKENHFQYFKAPLPQAPHTVAPIRLKPKSVAEL
jgi:hypothetical protein